MNKTRLIALIIQGVACLIQLLCLIIIWVNNRKIKKIVNRTTIKTNELSKKS